MTPPPKRPVKKTAAASPSKATPTPPAPLQDLTELRDGVLSLAERVNSLSTALSTVNDIQRLVIKNEQQAKKTEQKTKQIESDLIPRSEHEKRWKQEQAELIRTRLSIRRQTYVVGATFFTLSMLALALVAGLLIKDIHSKSHLQTQLRQSDALSRCQQSNQFRQGDKELWQEVISISSKDQTRVLTPSELVTQKKKTQEFLTFINKHDAPLNCDALPKATKAK